MMFVLTLYPRETQEMVSSTRPTSGRSGSSRGAACSGSAESYDNMKTAVETILSSARIANSNRRFLRDVLSSFLVRAGRLHASVGLGEGPSREPGRARAVSASSPPAAARFQELRDELNAWPHGQMHRLGQARTAIPSGPSRRSCLSGGRCSRRSGTKLIPYRGRFDGIPCALPASRCRRRVSVRFDNNKYSVSVPAAGRPPGRHSRAYAERVVIRQDGRAASWRNIHAAMGKAAQPYSDPCALRALVLWLASRALCATARRSRTGCCQPRWSG